MDVCYTCIYVFIHMGVHVFNIIASVELNLLLENSDNRNLTVFLFS